jgi:magnesium chelatase subunit H
MSKPLTEAERDRRVLELYEQVLEIEQRLIPTGLHIFGRKEGESEIADLLRMIASFDRPELGVRALPELIAAGLGFPSYQTLLKESAACEERLRQREQVEALTREAIARFLNAGAEQAVAMLTPTAAARAAELLKIFALLAQVRERLGVNDELGALMHALRGEYLEPGPGADIVQNPGVLPTGRNTYAVNPYHIPSPAAFNRAEPIVGALLERHQQETGRYPETIAMVLWGLDNIKTQGGAVAQALWLLGVKPRRDNLNRATDVEVIPLERLGRPRIDLVLTVSGIFRDLFGTTMELLDKAVHRVAQLDEPDEMNFVRRNVKAAMAEGLSFDDAAIRIFSNAAGNYGTNVNFMILDSQWEQDRAIGDLFITRKCFAYGRDARGRRLEGREARRLMERALARVEVTYQNIDTAEIGITDVDHYFEYLGGVSKAVETRAGARPRIYLSDALTPRARIRSLEETIRLETRTKTLNPKWYEGMLKHGFRGVAEIEHHVSNTFGWSATADAVDDWVYDDVAKTYLLDKQMLERLSRLNPHSTRNLIGRLLEAEGRGFWAASEEVIARLREAFSRLEDELEGVTV